MHLVYILITIDTAGPEQEALLADSVGLALLVVLDVLAPAERLAFVLHDVFGVPFSEIATVLDRSEAAAQQLASRARRRVQDSPTPDRDLNRQRRLVDAFFDAARDGDRLRPAPSHTPSRGRAQDRLYPHIVPALVNGTAGAIIAPDSRPFAVMGFTISRERITAIHVLVDPERLNQLNLVIP